MNNILPEQIELEKKLRVLDRLKDRLADREEEIVDLSSELEQFEAQYTMQVGRLYAEQDEVDALIAEEELKLVPDDEEIKKKVEELRRRADDSAARALAAEEHAAGEWVPTAEAKKAYHDLARIIHPDLALDADEKDRRHGLMAELNDAYSSRDQQRLNKLVHDFRNSPDLVKGDSVGDELVRAIRQIFQIRRRLIELVAEKAKLLSSELFDLHLRVNAEAEEGRDMLKRMSGRAQVHITKSKRRLLNLQSVNAAQEEYVKERFGLDIEDFRKN
ncbi:MAG: hypothetical protein IPN51_12795 [Chloracidobacterium sp.]|nr:hypothetical protein [Chloracidobacterium sp.]